MAAEKNNDDQVVGDRRALSKGRGCVSPFRQFESSGRRKEAAPSSLRLPILLLLSLAMVWLPAAFAAVHPIPLDKNTDAAKCLECHEDKSKAKAVHSAIALGCSELSRNSRQ